MWRVIVINEESVRADYLALSILHANADMQEIGDRFAIDRTEVSIAQFTLFAKAGDFISQAERNGGGKVYAFGWEQKLGWTWRTTFWHRAR